MCGQKPTYVVNTSQGVICLFRCKFLSDHFGMSGAAAPDFMVDW